MRPDQHLCDTFQYTFIMLDCPPSLSALAEAGIAAADLIVIPCQMEARASDGLVDLLEVISLIKGEEFNDWRILLTRVDSRKTTTNQAVMASLAPWASKIFKTTIPGYALKAGQCTYDCRYSTMHGMPVTGGRGFRGLKPLWYNGVPP
jgi:cellulose biosynthesis protein BcsQ